MSFLEVLRSLVKWKFKLGNKRWMFPTGSLTRSGKLHSSNSKTIYIANGAGYHDGCVCANGHPQNSQGVYFIVEVNLDGSREDT